VEVSSELKEMLAQAGKSEAEIKAMTEPGDWLIVINGDGTYSTGPDRGTWEYRESTGMIHMTIPESYKQGAIDGFRQQAGPGELSDKFMNGVTELRFRIEPDGKIWFSSNDHLEDSGIDLASMGVDPELLNMKYVFTKQ
jgi:hypothetical protein